MEELELEGEEEGESGTRTAGVGVVLPRLVLVLGLGTQMSRCQVPQLPLQELSARGIDLRDFLLNLNSRVLPPPSNEATLSQVYLRFRWARV